VEKFYIGNKKFFVLLKSSFMQYVWNNYTIREEVAHDPYRSTCRLGLEVGLGLGLGVRGWLGLGLGLGLGV
jgi:hypothetical protein